MRSGLLKTCALTALLTGCVHAQKQRTTSYLPVEGEVPALQGSLTEKNYPGDVQRITINGQRYMMQQFAGTNNVPDILPFQITPATNATLLYNHVKQIKGIQSTNWFVPTLAKLPSGTNVTELVLDTQGPWGIKVDRSSDLPDSKTGLAVDYLSHTNWPFKLNTLHLADRLNKPHGFFTPAYNDHAPNKLSFVMGDTNTSYLALNPEGSISIRGPRFYRPTALSEVLSNWQAQSATNAAKKNAVVSPAPLLPTNTPVTVKELK